MKRVIILFFIITTISTVAYAQKGHYFSANLGGGRHDIQYTLGNNGDKTAGLGFRGGLGWQWMFSEHFGVGLGADFNTLTISGKLAFAESTPNLTDNENGLNFTSNVSYNNLKEVDNMHVADIPLSLYYQAMLSERLRLLVGLNGFYTAVLSQKYKTKGGDIAVGKYFPDYNLDYSGLDDREHGVYSVSDFSGDMKLKKTLFGTGAQVQLCYALGETRRVELVFGIYGAYRFADQKDNASGKVFNFETAEYKGITQSDLAGKVSSANLGGAVGLRVRIGGKEKEPEIEEEPIKPTETEQLVVQNVPEQPSDSEQPTEDEQPSDSEKPTENEQPADSQQPTEVEQKTTEPLRPQVSRLEELLANVPPIQMPFNSCTIVPSMRPILDDVAAAWKDNQSQKILLTGHTCNIGTAEVNMRLGAKRAESVKQELVNRGVSPSKISTESRGDTEPIAPNTTDQNRQKNRRVEIKLVK
ncbi:MAG: OmpA family protein [Bacteroidales bacterium]|nr:OmpA family protein [Bacteroidales bacterium]